MENDYFETALNSLKKTQDKRKMLQILVVVRKSVDNTSDLYRLKKLNESGCAKHLIACLQHDSGSILDLTLSILGNCCVDPNFAKDSMKLNILHSLNRVLEKHDKDSIQGRVFRTVGNLCDSVCSNIVMIKEPLLIDKVVSFLKNASRNEPDGEASEASITMALRAIRKLLKRSTLGKLIRRHEVLQGVGMLLVKYARRWETDRQHENVLQDILRLLHLYSNYNHPDMISSLKNTGGEDALECLSVLVTLNPTRVVKIVLNFDQFCFLKSDLPIPLIWERLFKGIRETNNDNLHKEYLKCMCKLVDQPSNREYMRLGDNVAQLVGMLKNYKNCTDFTMECCTIIVSMLCKCQFDDALILKQIQLGIVNVLIEKIEWLSPSCTSIVVPHHSCKRKAKRSPNANSKRLKLLSSYSNDFNATTLDASPYKERCVSPSECSEISSNGPNSPSCAVTVEDVSDSDNYSPVCSDAEDTDVNSLPPIGAIDANYTSESDDDYLDKITNHNDKVKCKFFFEEVCTLLMRYSRIRPIVMDLANPRLLIVLMNVSVGSSELNGVSQNMVSTLIRTQEYLVPIMLTDFVPMVHSLTTTEHGIRTCSLCHHISMLASTVLSVFVSVAEFGSVKGDIAHRLIRAGAEVKQKLVLSVPYIIRNKQTLSKLMLNCGGLDVLIKLLVDENELQKKSIKALCMLAIHHLKIKNPVNDQTSTTKSFEMNNYELSADCTNIVTFKLDDGTAVKADRDFLSEKSDYFNRLLTGDFKESAQKEITLQNVTHKSLICLLSLLEKNIVELGVVNINVDLETMLDLIELTERFLMVDLNVYLSSYVEQFHMSYDTVPVIYQWSIESGTNILRVEAVAFAIVGNIADSKRLAMFQSLFNLGYSEQLVDDLQNLLTRFLK